MMDEALIRAMENVPPGRWAVAVSGGADSVALLHLLHHHRPLVQLHVAHLDHELRGAESSGDAAFVTELARGWGLELTVARRSELERKREWPGNPSARWRAMRLELFGRVCREHGLAGVAMAHHRDDQAETILQRLLRGSGPGGLAGMSHRGRLGGLVVLRPLLEAQREQLRAYLRRMGQGWREDASNESQRYGRNRVRRVLKGRPEVTERLLATGRAMAELRNWVDRCAPKLGEAFELRELCDLPEILAEHSARRWLAEHGVPQVELTPGVVRRLIEMAGDAASALRQHFPGRLLVRRRRGMICVDR